MYGFYVVPLIEESMKVAIGHLLVLFNLFCWDDMKKNGAFWWFWFVLVICLSWTIFLEMSELICGI